jgi:molybdopterin-guanine dinucleotide biosynthesis protein A
MKVSVLQPIFGVILAGGLARRMGGGDKGLQLLDGRPLLAHVIDRLRPQVNSLVLNANGEATRFAKFGLAVVPDSLADHPGPLAGILAGLDWAATYQDATGWIVTVPGDCPFLPRDLVARLADGLMAPSDRAVVASYGRRLQPVIGLWSVALRVKLRQAIEQDGVRRVEDWCRRCSATTIDFPPREVDPFFNVNTPDDLTRAAALLGSS